jgi:hypothetical protein
LAQSLGTALASASGPSEPGNKQQHKRFFTDSCTNCKLPGNGIVRHNLRNHDKIAWLDKKRDDEAALLRQSDTEVAMPRLANAFRPPVWRE